MGTAGAQCIAEVADRTIETAPDRARIEARLERTRQTLESEAASGADAE
jgi:hypothetical protein